MRPSLGPGNAKRGKNYGLVSFDRVTDIRRGDKHRHSLKSPVIGASGCRSVVSRRRRSNLVALMALLVGIGYCGRL